MASRRLAKRKSPCKDTIFLEVNDNELSPEPHGHEDSEPEFKIMKTDTTSLEDKAFEVCSLTENDVENNKSPTKFVLSFEEPENVSCKNDSLFANTNNIKDTTEKLESKHLEDGEVNGSLIDKDNIANSNIPSNEEMCIFFGSKELANLYKFRFMTFLNSFVELEVVKETDLCIKFQRDSIFNPSDWIVVDETLCSNKNSENTYVIQQSSPSKSKKKKAKKKKKEENLFVLDTNPSENESTSLNTKYLSKFQIEIEEKDDDTPKRLLTQICFNCNENHSLKDCPLPKVQARINAARNKFKAQKQTTRYHLEEDQKYSHFTPGKISPALREALGLRKCELPPYIYRMRVLGYPPGWLEDAKFIYSNLDMFDAEGKTVRQNSQKKKQGLNSEKIIEYSGFNVPLEKNIRDEYKYYNVPPYSDNFNKQAMISFFEKQYANQQDDYETCEMDVDVSENDAKEKIMLDNPQVKGLKESGETGVSSPSLLDLEKQKEKLLLALEDNTSSNIVSEENSNAESETISSSKEVAIEHQDESIIKLSSIDDSVLDNSVDEGISDSEKTFMNTSIKSSSMGTPILKSKSQYLRLPNMDNFTKDVSPVINFENLPNSTGKYEQMTEVLQKVRNQMKDLHNCKS